jgi:basic membrane lipoprotein Med (substrate-binding protein (PBP1-ABC) superfamily)
MRTKLARVLISVTLLTFFFTPDRTNAASTAPTPVKIAIALEVGGLGDNSFNDAVVNAARAVQKKYKISDSYIRAVPTDGTPADRFSRLKFLAKAGYGLIIAIGADYAPAIKRATIEFPDVQYALVNSSAVAGMNVSCLVFAEAGAAFGNKNVLTTSVPFTDSAINLKNAIANGVDLIYSTRLVDGEVLNLVAKANLKKRKVWLIAQSPDQYYAKLPTAKKEILVTLDKRIDHAITDVIMLALTGGSILGIVDEMESIYGRVYNFSNSGLNLSYLNPVTAATKTTVSRAIAQIKSGKVSTIG